MLPSFNRDHSNRFVGPDFSFAAILPMPSFGFNRKIAWTGCFEKSPTRIHAPARQSFLIFPPNLHLQTRKDGGLRRAKRNVMADPLPL
jgi:hypothetical protein